MNGASPPEAAERTDKLILDNISNLFGFHGLAYIIGSLNIPYFCKYFLQDTFVPKPENTARELAPVHLEIWDELDKMFLQDEYDKLEAILPRGCAKTTFLDFALTVWLHAYNKSKYTLVAGHTEGDSVAFISQTRQAFEENAYILVGFGKLIRTNDFTVNKLELELANKTKIQAISSTSSMRGKKYGDSRPSCIIADDYQSQADIITEASRLKKYSTWAEDSAYSGDKAVFRAGVKIKPATKFIVIGTILHKSCFMSSLMLDRDYKHILKRALDFDVSDFFNEGVLWKQFKTIYFDDKRKDPQADAKEFYYQNEKEMQYKTIWPDKYQCLDLSIDFYNNPIAFAQEMQNDASKIGLRWFTSMKTQSSKEIEEHIFKRTMLIVDPASSVSIKSDFSAFCVGSVAENNFSYIRKGIIERLGFDDLCLKTIELLKAYPDITHLGLEKNLYMGADTLKIRELIAQEPELKNRNIEILNKMQRAGKDDRIATIVQGVNMGQIIFNEDDVTFNNQILDFAGQDYSEHDDAVDSVAQFKIDVKDINIIGKVTFLDRHLLGI